MVRYLATEIRWQDRNFHVPLERIKLSEQWGYDAVFTAEGWGSDALTPLAFVAGHTKRLKLGTHILQVTGRPPVTTARALMTLEHMAGPGRVIAGLGSSTPMITDGLTGQPWGKPLARMRDYVAIMRKAFNGEPLEYQGPEISIPRAGGNSPPMTLQLAPTPDIPIMIGGLMPGMVRLGAEIGDGLMPYYAPGVMKFLQPLMDEGFARRPRPKEDFEIWGHVDMLVCEDIRAGMRPFKEYTVAYAEIERHTLDTRCHLGLADRLLELSQSGHFEEAINAVPDDYIDTGWLIGPVSRIKERVRPYLESELTGLVVRYGPQVGKDGSNAPENLDAFRAIAEAVGRA